ncbi:hypothetical protein D3C71_24930 [compost metagenome]
MTRCDFYAGRGADAHYLGSISWAARVEFLKLYFARVSSREHFSMAVKRVLQARDGSPAERGWPWPWPDSHRTGGVVAFDAGHVWCRHESGYWAQLEHHDLPTSEPCVLPTMLQPELSEAMRRLACELHETAGMCLHAPEHLMVRLLMRATVLLSDAFLHVFQHHGEYLVRDSFWSGARKLEWDIYRLGMALEHSQDFPRLLAYASEQQPAAEWGILRWLSKFGKLPPAKTVWLTVDEDQPGIFGLPAGPQTDRGAQSIRFREMANPHQTHVILALLEQMLDRVPSCFAAVIVQHLLDMRALPVPRSDVEAWTKQPQPKLKGLSLDEACATKGGRELVRRLACDLALSRQLPT